MRWLEKIIGNGLIQLGKLKYTLFSPKIWRPTLPIKLCIFSYVGARNVGADVRVHEIVRQLYKILGYRNTEISVVTLNKEYTKDYFEKASQTQMPFTYFSMLGKLAADHHVMIAAEGAAFQDKFTAAFPIATSVLLSLTHQQNKPSIAYCIDAGKMHPDISKFVQTHCKDSLLIARSDESQKKIKDSLQLPCLLGADSAYTFKPSSKQCVEELMSRRFFNHQRKLLLGIAPMHPFRFPISFQPGKALVSKLSSKYADQQYKGFLFFSDNKAIRDKYNLYLENLSKAVNRFIAMHCYQPVILGMHDIDKEACNDLAARLNCRAPIFTSCDYSMFDMVGIIQSLNILISSRYHAVVTSMPALIPSGAIGICERLDNLMKIRRHSDLIVKADEKYLEEKIHHILLKLHEDQEVISKEIEHTLLNQVELFGLSGKYLLEELLKFYPELEVEQTEGQNWKNFIPDPPDRLKTILGM